MTGETKNTAISMHWFPSCPLGANVPLLFDNEYSDFDQQAEQLAGHDQAYLQLTPGPFAGRFFSGFLGPDVSIHLEYCNQALEQRIGGDPNAISFGLVLNEASVFRVNGRMLTGSDVMVLPPGGSLDIVSPVDGAIMAIVVDACRLLAEPGLAPQIADWLDRKNGDVGLLHAPRLADRMREDAIHALECASVVGADNETFGPVLGNALIAGIAAKLSLEWAVAAETGLIAGANSYMRFLQCRDVIYNKCPDIDGAVELAQIARTSKRSVEQAFSEQLSIGPLTYLRILRLHNVRRTLGDPASAHLSIGDIAATNGFWNWSRFSHLYKQHFGQLPSTARATVLA